MEPNDATQQDRRGFLQAGVAATTLAVAGLPSAARGTTEATGKMKIENVGVMSPGDMGQAVAIQIKARGLHVYTALEHRSERTRGLAREAGLTDVSTLARLVVECDVVLSIMDPGAAVDFAREVSDAIHTSGRRTLIVDCNAIAPQTCTKSQPWSSKRAAVFSTPASSDRHHAARRKPICTYRDQALPIWNSLRGRSSSSIRSANE